MRVLIVDDEAPARARLRRLVNGITDIDVVGEADDGGVAVERILSLKPEVVLLDIGMPRLTGFDVVAALGDEMPLTIFCTAYDEHALRAFDAKAVDYLLKPVQPERMAAALDRVRLLLNSSATVQRRDRKSIAAVVEERGAFLLRILVHDAQCAYLLPVNRVDLIRADRNHCWVHSDGKRFRVRRTLISLVERLDPAQFLQVNKSDIVRIDAMHEIQPWSHGDYRVMMRDGSSLTWSRRYRDGADRLSS